MDSKPIIFFKMVERARSTSLPEALESALNPIPVPTDPKHFLGKLLYAPIDDESGQLTAAAEHNDKIGQVNVQTRVDEERGVILFEGAFNPDTHPAFRIPIESHEKGGMTFILKSVNKHKGVFARDLCKRSFTKRHIQTLLSEGLLCSKTPFTFVAHAPGVAYGLAESKIILTLDEERGGRLYVRKVCVEMTFKAYEAWIWTLIH
jgi:hypothetical protein